MNQNHPSIGGRTAAPVTESENNPPEFLTARGVRQVFGIGRSTLYSLLAAGRIRGVTLRATGCKSGRRLFDAASIRTHLNAAA